MLAGAEIIISLVVGLSVLVLVTGVRAIVASGEPVDHLGDIKTEIRCKCGPANA